MKKRTLALTLVVVILIASTATAVLWFEFSRSRSMLYTYPISVGEKTYIVTVRTNWNPAPKVYLPEFSTNYISVDFIGSFRKTVTFNITVPTDLLWGNISLVWKYYVQNPDRYTLSNNGTYNSIQMTFTHIATDEHFEIHGTEGAW